MGQKAAAQIIMDRTGRGKAWGGNGAGASRLPCSSGRSRAIHQCQSRPRANRLSDYNFGQKLTWQGTTVTIPPSASSSFRRLKSCSERVSIISLQSHARAPSPLSPLCLIIIAEEAASRKKPATRASARPHPPDIPAPCPYRCGATSSVPFGLFWGTGAEPLREPDVARKAAAQIIIHTTGRGKAWGWAWEGALRLPCSSGRSRAIHQCQSRSRANRLSDKFSPPNLRKVTISVTIPPSGKSSFRRLMMGFVDDNQPSYNPALGQIVFPTTRPCSACAIARCYNPALGQIVFPTAIIRRSSARTKCYNPALGQIVFPTIALFGGPVAAGLVTIPPSGKSSFRP